MRKTILTLIFGILLSITGNAQNDLDERSQARTSEDIIKIDALVNLTDDEKASYNDFSNAYYLEYFKIAKKHKTNNLELFKEKINETNAVFVNNLKKEYGKKRAYEILKARRSK
ncbi:hypothetical protein [Algibacter sp. L3A6]|uniref:hypothetical protein n=1 Tax=Algibacter sp. L3A6 TaxID=2686366 RepID=UPI00131AD576|nr:hypothetical protein [Algibacter sp. L3A6]